MDIENGEIRLTEMLNEHIASFCMSTFCSDVNLIIEGEKIPAHRFMLAARCEYFQKLFFKNSQSMYKNEFELKISLAAFRTILQYFYTGHMILSDINNIDTLFETFNLVNEMDIFELKEYFEIYLNRILSVENVVQMLKNSRKFHIHLFEIKCLYFIDNNSKEILTSEIFRNISKELLEEILCRNNFSAPEHLIFLAMNEWCKHNKQNIETVIHLVNLSLIPFKELLKIRKLGILSAEKIFDAIERQTVVEESWEQLNTPNSDANVSIPEINAQTGLFATNIVENINFDKIIKEDETIEVSELFDCNYNLIKGEIICPYPLNAKNGYTRHIITEKNDSSLIIEFNKILLFNHIKMLLSDRDNRTYSYFIEGSIDKKTWDSIIDYSEYRCRSYQNLYFPDKIFKYIKIVGTYCSKDKYFDVVKLNVRHTDSIPRLINGFVVPKKNVALVEMGATVLEGNGDPNKNNLINGENNKNSGYTWHNIGSGSDECILIRLSQPYVIDSIRLFLNDQNDRKYKFYIEASLNKKDWYMLVDQRNEFKTSWQTFNFPSRPVIFIRIVGTDYNNRLLNSMLVNTFECPVEYP